MPVVIARKAERIMDGSPADVSATAFHFVKGAIKPFWSSSVSGNFPAEGTATSVVIAKTGMEDSPASTSPGRM